MKFIIAILLSLSSVAFASDKVNSVEDLYSQFKDPDSVKVQMKQSAYDSRGHYYACGLVNAKNGFGGYVGYRAFQVVKGKFYMHPDGDTDSACRNISRAFHDLKEREVAFDNKLWARAEEVAGLDCGAKESQKVEALTKIMDLTYFAKALTGSGGQPAYAKHRKFDIDVDNMSFRFGMELEMFYQTYSKCKPKSN